MSVPDNELRVDVFRVATTESKTGSGVRVTHLPTGTQVEVWDQDSQLQNKTEALRRLTQQLRDG